MAGVSAQRLSTGNGLPNVVVTGVAMSTALATDAETTWQKLLDGQSGIRLLEDDFIEKYDRRLGKKVEGEMAACAVCSIM